MPDDEKILIENVMSPHHTERVNKAKYMAMRHALLAALPEQAPGLTVAEANIAIIPHLSDVGRHVGAIQSDRTNVCSLSRRCRRSWLRWATACHQPSSRQADRVLAYNSSRISGRPGLRLAASLKPAFSKTRVEPT
jgi:hypothetical protein